MPTKGSTRRGLFLHFVGGFHNLKSSLFSPYPALPPNVVRRTHIHGSGTTADIHFDILQQTASVARVGWCPDNRDWPTRCYSGSSGIIVSIVRGFIRSRIASGVYDERDWKRKPIRFHLRGENEKGLNWERVQLWDVGGPAVVPPTTAPNLSRCNRRRKENVT